MEEKGPYPDSNSTWPCAQRTYLLALSECALDNLELVDIGDVILDRLIGGGVGLAPRWISTVARRGGLNSRVGGGRRGGAAGGVSITSSAHFGRLGSRLIRR